MISRCSDDSTISGVGMPYAAPCLCLQLSPCSKGLAGLEVLTGDALVSPENILVRHWDQECNIVMAVFLQGKICSALIRGK